MKLRHFVLCLILIALFALADFVRGHGLHVAGSAIDVAKLLVCAALFVAAWRAGQRLLAVVGLVVFSLTA